MDVVTVTTYRLVVESPKADATELEKRLDQLGLQICFDPKAKKLGGKYNVEGGLLLRTYYSKSSGNGQMIQDLAGWFGFRIENAEEVTLKGK